MTRQAKMFHGILSEFKQQFANLDNRLKSIETTPAPAPVPAPAPAPAPAPVSTQAAQSANALAALLPGADLVSGQTLTNLLLMGSLVRLFK